ncbi:efflux RND transporter periplasmic adaptor subunit [Tateyamaria pelophila]|uniref:efflux RND transporter periplasmic adaptor subunit n=1 Tax=Tateyamaria pelophila TaxID=328415 RepID=UPI001CBF0EDF|nr:efflux RND transporter periplasmic adaptor subunit [Tateyamaria pelophila]
MLQSATAEEAPSTQADFPGLIEALNSHEVSNLIDGVVTEVHFKPGQFVEAGDILFSIDPGPYELTVKTQRLNTVRAETTLSSARQDLERIQKLKDRGSATDVQMLKAVVALSLGEARLEQAKAELKSAESDLEDTVIRARISGIISQSAINPGAYVEKGRAPLARIDQMDPVLLSYEIPYVDRIEQLAIDNLRTPSELLDRVTLSIKISETWLYPETTTPDNLSSRVDMATGTMTIWAELANPNFRLRPGMRVRVQSVINGQ